MTVLAPLHRGDSRRVEIRDAKDKAGNVLDLSLYTVRFSAKRATDSVPYIAKSSATAGQVVILALGNADVVILPSDTNGLTRKTVLDWDVEISSGPDDVWTFDSGTWEIVMDVSR